MRVHEIMTSHPACCTPGTNLEEVAHMMVRADCGEIPVLEVGNGRKPIGVVTDRDIVCRAIANGLNPVGMTAEDVMSQPVVTVTPDMAVDDAIQVLEEKQIRRAPVVDDTGACCGMISLADIALSTSEKKTGAAVKTISQRIIPLPATMQF